PANAPRIRRDRRPPLGNNRLHPVKCKRGRAPDSRPRWFSRIAAVPADTPPACLSALPATTWQGCAGFVAANRPFVGQPSVHLSVVNTSDCTIQERPIAHL